MIYAPNFFDRPPMDGVPAVRRQDRFQKVLLGIAVAYTVLSAIAPLRVGAGLAIRGVSILSVLATMESPATATSYSTAIKSMQIAGLVLGMVALVASMPLFMALSIGVDMGIQAAEGIRAAKNGDWRKAAMHVALLAVDTLTLLSIVFVSWELLAAASLINIGMMFTMSYYAFTEQNRQDLGAFLCAMAAINLIGLGLMIGK